MYIYILHLYTYNKNVISRLFQSSNLSQFTEITPVSISCCSLMRHLSSFSFDRDQRESLFIINFYSKVPIILIFVEHTCEYID